MTGAIDEAKADLAELSAADGLGGGKCHYALGNLAGLSLVKRSLARS
ncbi:hypothetical protein [Mesorhizobium silamurunense]